VNSKDAGQTGTGQAKIHFDRLHELAVLFLKLGAISFGGPAAHIALIETEIVRKREWITRQQFLDMVGAASLIPGPTSTETAITVGFVRAGWPGLCVALAQASFCRLRSSREHLRGRTYGSDLCRRLHPSLGESTQRCWP
jgi:hypothetical protein